MFKFLISVVAALALSLPIGHAQAVPPTPFACAAMMFDAIVEMTDAAPAYQAPAGQRVLVFGSPSVRHTVDLRQAASSCFQAGPGGSTAWGGAGDDVLIGGAGNDYFRAGAGTDTCIGLPSMLTQECENVS